MVTWYLARCIAVVKGTYLKGMRHGAGIMTWPEGSRYSGVPLGFCRGGKESKLVLGGAGFVSNSTHAFLV
eukprot:2752462-Amphidinium_carterae.1